MKRRLLTLTASAFILASSIGLAQAQQSTGDRPMPQRNHQDAQGQQGQGMMGSGMGMTPEMMQRMQPKMGEQRGHMGMGHGSMMGHGGMRGHGGMLRIMFAIMDANGDGALSLAEVQDIHARIFKHVDVDKNGQVTLKEIQAFFRGTEPAADSKQ